MISTKFAVAFGLRYMLGRYGYDPCDEWDVEAMLGLPEGLRYAEGEVQFQCRRCENWMQWPGDVVDFDVDDPNNLCGGSPWCIP